MCETTTRTTLVLTMSRRMLEVLKSRYMTGFFASWRKASPFAAPNAIFILIAHERGSNTSTKDTHSSEEFKQEEKRGVRTLKLT